MLYQENDCISQTVEKLTLHHLNQRRVGTIHRGKKLILVLVYNAHLQSKSFFNNS